MMGYTLTYYGHSTVGLEIGGVQILIDPFFIDNPSTKIEPTTLNPDYILVSHGHGDHVGDTVEIVQESGSKVIANAEISRWLGDKGVEVHPQHIGGGNDYPFGYVKLTQAVHGSSMPDGSYGGMPAGFLITTPKGEKIYHAGDTGLFAGMSLIGEEGVHLALLPIGDNYTMGPDDALRAVKLIQPKYAIPIHYNTWDLIAQDPAPWKRRVESETDTIVHILQPDKSIEL
jgi:L-ascorbate metabolism protein UlaG (beta-lactamase superfamily)